MIILKKYTNLSVFFLQTLCIIFLSNPLKAHDLRTPKNTSVPHEHFSDSGWYDQFGNYLTAGQWTVWADSYFNKSHTDRANKAYNCHAYAWASANQGEPSSWLWLNSPNDNLYWEDNSYEEVPQALATHVSYGDGIDHSLLVYNGNTMISKWGKLPVYLHQIFDDPYGASTSDVKFYRLKQTAPLTSVSIYGPDVMYKTGNYYFYSSLQDGVGPFSYKWEMRKIAETEKQMVVRAAPPSIWLELYIYDHYIRLYPPNNGDYRDFELRCTVTDIGGGVSKISNIWFVDVVNGYYPYQNLASPADQKDLVNNNQEIFNFNESNKILTNLEDCFPNPFNPSTNISYSLNSAEKVILKIFNTLGQEVATLVNEIKEAGYYKVSFNASNLPSGIYFQKLQVGNKVFSKKMILTK